MSTGHPRTRSSSRHLLAYSPYHNIKDGVDYPATLIMTADTDDRVVPMHSFKFAAALQRAQAGNAPILLRIETRAGHGHGTPISQADRQRRRPLGVLGQEPPDGRAGGEDGGLAPLPAATRAVPADLQFDVRHEQKIDDVHVVVGLKHYQSSTARRGGKELSMMHRNLSAIRQMKNERPKRRCFVKLFDSLDGHSWTPALAK